MSNNIEKTIMMHNKILKKIIMQWWVETKKYCQRGHKVNAK